MGLQNTRPIRVEDLLVPLAPPVCVLIRKMVCYDEGKSEKHLKDIEGILLRSISIDAAPVTRCAQERDLGALWSRLSAQRR